MILLLMFGCSAKDEKPDDNKQEKEIIKETISGLGSTIDVGSTSIIIGEEIVWFLQEYEHSPLYGQYMFKIPVELVNINDGVSEYTIYIGNWRDLEGNDMTLPLSFQEDDIISKGNGENDDYYFYIPYLGDGKYIYVLCDDETREITIEFDIIIPGEYK